jgi:trigger factor
LYERASLKIQKDAPSPREVSLTIELAPDELEPYMQRAYARVVNRVRIPGFRPGKAPRTILENYMGRQALLQEAVEIAVPDTVQRALKAEGVEAFAQPEVEVLKLEPLSIKALIPLTPTVELGDYKNLRLKGEPVNVTDEQVQQALEKLREESGQWEPANRPVKLNDLVTLDLRGTVAGNQVANSKGLSMVARKDSPYPLPGFSEQLEGIAVEQEKEFVLPIPEDYTDKSLASKSCNFWVKVLDVKERKLPELNDEFAKGVGEGYDSLDQLCQKTKDKLIQKLEHEENHRLQEQALEELIKNVKTELPPTLTEREVEALLEDQERAIKQSDPRMDLETYLQGIRKSKEELKAELRPKAIDRLVRVLVVRKLAELEGIKVTDQEVEEELSRIASTSGKAGSSLRQALSSPRGRLSFSSSILRRKVLERLEQIVTQGTTPEPSTSAGSQQPQGGNP